MLGIKTKINNHLEEKFIKIFKKSQGISFFENLILIFFAKKKLKNEAKIADIQSVISRKTNKFASKIIKNTADYMPNNLGNWSIKEPETFTEKAELRSIEIIKKYYKCNDEIAGHFCSGSTEGNIYATWMGRNYLLKELLLKNSEKIAIIKSSLAHYSISKAADITGISLFEASIDKDNFNLNEIELTKKIDELYKKKYRGFLIPLTLGYTVTGTDDDYQQICQIIEKVEKKYKDCKFFIWLDAAFSGISKIFTQENFRPFSNRRIQLITVDLHKLLAVPYPANITLYKKSLLKYISKEIPYIDQLDTTLLGSRPGLNALASLASLINLDKKRMKKIIHESFIKKEKFLKKISNENLNIGIINNKESLQACLISNDQSSLEKIEKKYNLKHIKYKLLINQQMKIKKMYKLYFLPKF